VAAPISGHLVRACFLDRALEPVLGARHEIFGTSFTLLLLKYRAALNRLYLATGLLWIAWCLYWPFLVRDQDIQEVMTEANEAYEVCLQQRGVTPTDCSTDRTAYEKLLREMAAPPQENAYQSFAGENASDAIAFMSVLCLVPPLIVFALIRLVLEVWLFFAHTKGRDIRASR
jgi:hypothetical protein